VIWVYDMVFKTQALRDSIYNKLVASGIPARLFFKPMTQQPMYFREKYKKTKAYMYSCRGLYLQFSRDQQEFDSIIKIIKEKTQWHY